MSTEAAWALGNLASGADKTQISTMISEYGYADCLRTMLDNASPKVKQIGLEASLNVLNSGKGDNGAKNLYLKDFQMAKLVEKIEAMGGSQNSVLNGLVDNILEFFDDVEEEDSQATMNNLQQGEVENPEDDTDSDDGEDEDNDDDSSGDEDERRQIEDKDDSSKYQNMERED